MASKTEDFNEEVESLKDKAKKSPEKPAKNIWNTYLILKKKSNKSPVTLPKGLNKSLTRPELISKKIHKKRR